MKSTLSRNNTDIIELVTFFIGDAIYGMDILKVQEINKLMEITFIPQAPEYVKGIVNLRGNIVTIIDLGKKLGLSATKVTDECRNIIINSDNEYVGLLVEKVEDVIRTNVNNIESPPANIVGVHGKFFNGVFKTNNSLIGVLNVEEVLKLE